MNKYLEFFCIAIRHEQRHRSIILGRSAFYIVLLLIYSSLWRAAEHSGLRVEYSAAEMLWYLATTEWIVLSTPSIYLDIEGDFRNGSLVYQLARPVSYLGSRLAENLGTAVVRMAYLAVVGITCTTFFSGEFLLRTDMLPWIIALGLLAQVLCVLSVLVIGLCSFWLHECSPIYWVWQKLLFIFGGLILPLSIYPEWLQSIAKITPFYPTLYGVGRLVSEGSNALAMETLALLLVWLMACLLLVAAVYQRALRGLEIAGG